MYTRIPMALALAAFGTLAATLPIAAHADTSKTTTVQRSKGADGLTDKVVIHPNGKTTSVNRYRGGDGAVDKTVTGGKGGTKVVDRSVNADGTVNKTVTATRP